MCLLQFVLLAVLSTRLGVAVAAASQGQDALQKCPPVSDAEYDYIVVGAGGGGGPVAYRLVESGFKVLVVETGKDESQNPTTLNLSGSWAAMDDPTIDLDYRVNEYPSDFHVQRNDIWYPRSAGIGGCTLHNALSHSTENLHETFDNLARTFNDSSWSRENMQKYLVSIERNLFLTPPNPDHGFDGWLTTVRGPVNFSSTDPQWQAFGTAWINEAGPLVEDISRSEPLPPRGRGLRQWTGEPDFTRVGVRDKLAEVAARYPERLTIMTDTLATRVLLCGGKERRGTKAYGVAVAQGAKLPVAQGFKGKEDLQEKRIVAKREVIVAGGAFQTPQLLMLSGIGDFEQLRELGLPTIVDLPGVGSNLQDNDEVPVWWEFNTNFTNPTSVGEAFYMSANSTTLEPDMNAYTVTNQFSGFQHGISIIAANTRNVLTIVNIRGPSTSQGYVRLTGAHPQDGLDINKMRFQGHGGREDIVALREGVKRWRAVVNDNAEVMQYVRREVSPGLNVTSDEDIEEYILKNVFAHHACCTAAMGPDGDSQAVLDGDFKVRGVRNLRVVDASSMPEVFGYFPTTPLYLVAEKAADVIIKATKRK
ncbi:choline dehydrogenase [Favolaschia claudopus]|uniref:Choline dehydrogenase n=1 Tax=Favolaschia claudopus TaxID=2862362 RepID=A0AAW0A9J1_9AGAR